MENFPFGSPFLSVLVLAVVFYLLGLLSAKMWRKQIPAGKKQGQSTYIKGLNYVLSKQTDKAIEEFIRFTHLDPDTTDAYIGLGHLYRSKGDFDRAIRLHRSILARPDLEENDRIQTLLALGSDYKSAGLWGRAIGVFQQVLEINPNKVECYQELAAIYVEERNWVEAFRTQQEHDRRTGAKQKNVLAHLQTEMGKEALAKGDREMASKSFKSALSIDPDCLDAALHLGDLYQEEGKIGKAITIWEGVALRNAPFSFLAYKRLEKAYFTEGRYDDIAGLLEQVVKADPKNIMARVSLGEYYSKRDMLPEALEHLREALAAQPRSLEARMQMEQILVRHRMYEEMEKEYSNAIKILYAPRERYLCRQCGLQAKELSWRCPQCRSWDTFSIQS